MDPGGVVHVAGLKLHAWRFVKALVVRRMYVEGVAPSASGHATVVGKVRVTSACFAGSTISREWSYITGATLAGMSYPPSADASRPTL